MAKQLSKNSAVKLGLEVVGIILAVLVALAADQWVEDQERNERKNRVLKNIHTEIESNADELKNSLEELNQQIELLRKIMIESDKDQPVRIEGDVIKVWRISLPSLRATSWQSLTLQSDIFTIIDLDTIEHFSSIYTLQEDFKNYGSKLVADFGDKTARLIEPEQGRGVLRNHLYSLSTAQQLAASLLELYNEYLEASD